MWRKYQKDNRTKRNLKLAFIVLGLLVLLILVAKIFSVFGSLYQPFNSAISSNKKYTWDGDSSFNILVYFPEIKSTELGISDSKMALINLQPEDNKIIILHISDDIYTSLPKGFGEWRVGSIYKLGLDEGGVNLASELLKLSISKLVGLPVDGLIITNRSDGNFSIKQEIESWRKNPLASFRFVRQVKTDLTPVELYRFFKEASSVRSDNISSLNLAKTNITESKLLADSSRVLGVDAIKLDNFIRDNMLDSFLVGEGETISVFNGSDYPGLAQEAARILTNMGFNVISLRNTENSFKESTVEYLSNENEKSRTFTRIAQIFAPNCLDKKCNTDDIRVKSSRAQINVVIGEDYYKMWYKK